MKHSHALPLLCLPPLLVALLGVAQWRAAHPPLSTLDRQFCAAMDKAPWVFVSGVGGTWYEDTGIPFDPQAKQVRGFLVQDGAALRDIREALRCEEPRASPLPSVYRDFCIWIPLDASPTGTATTYQCFDYMDYGNDGKRATVRPFRVLAHGEQRFDKRAVFAVRPQFAARFEALLTRLSKRAGTKGSHPEIEVGNFPHAPVR